jgi:RNA polymerase sigma-70 factor, ECF subfamily
MHSLSDEQLMGIYQQNKDGQGQNALDHLYHRYSKSMFNFFYFALHNDYDKARDFVHDLFLKIIEKKESFDHKRLFKAWIYRIASNMCKNEFRRTQVNKKYIYHVKTSSEIIDSNLETESELRKCINGLRQDQRSLIVLRFKLKLTIKEIAEIYECPEGTVKSRLFNVVKELSKSYKK